MAKTKVKWLLLQTRIEQSMGRELRDLASEEGISSSAYLRRLVMLHLKERKKEAAPPVGMEPLLAGITGSG
jgi:hypothetical protein